MFHRVLPPTDGRFAGSNPGYTITPDELDQCFCLFKHNYNVVSIGQVAAACAGQSVLPHCPLLISFDDGWQDNFQYALPVLKRHEFPALLFVATGYIGSETSFWQEEVMSLALTRPALCPDFAKGAYTLIDELNEMPHGQRESYLASLPNTTDLPRRMADAAELMALRDDKVAIGGHGHSHEPMTELKNPEAEFAACRDSLRALKLLETPAAFSFPHGRFDSKLVSLARTAGFDMLFTSRHTLAACADLPDCDTIGRIEMNLLPFRIAAGKLDEAKLMIHLATHPTAKNEAMH